MKFRTMLLATAAVMVASTASAKDIADFTNPFSLPTEGKILSDTRFEYGRTRWDDGILEDIEKGMYASEDLTFGLGNGFAVVAHIGNTFDYDAEGGEYNNDHNFDYGLGVKYNHDFGKVLTQVGAGISAYDPQSFYGQNYIAEDEDDNGDRWHKELHGYAMVGYDAGCITPYTKLAVDGEIDTNDNEQLYTWTLGVHKKWEKVSADASVNYYFGEFEEENGDGKDKIDQFYLNAEANYFVTDNFAVGAYGSYYLGGEGHKDVDYDYTVGLSARVLF